MSYTGLAIARAFRDTGIKVYGLGSNKWAAGNYSKYLKFIPSPDSMTEGKELLTLLSGLARKETLTPLLFPTRDQDILFIKQYRNDIDKYFITTLPPNATLDLIMNKYHLYNLSVECGLPVPKTILLNTSRFEPRVLSQVTMPFLIKPVCSADWQGADVPQIVRNRKAVWIRSYDQFVFIVNELKTLKKKALIQEYVRGDDSDICTFCSYVNKKGKMLASFNTRKIRQLPEKLGIGAIVGADIIHDVADASITLVEKLNLTGVSEIEYKKDSLSNQHVLIEMNPRFWDQHKLSNSFGVNLPLLVYNEEVGSSQPSHDHIFFKSTWIAEDRFLQIVVDRILTKPRDILTLFREIKGHKTFALWDIRDPMPFIMSTVTKLLSLAKMQILRLFTKR